MLFRLRLNPVLNPTNTLSQDYRSHSKKSHFSELKTNYHNKPSIQNMLKGCVVFFIPGHWSEISAVVHLQETKTASDSRAASAPH